MIQNQDFSNSLILYGESRLDAVTPSTGRNAGESVDVLTFKARHPNYKVVDGKPQHISTDFYTVKYWGSAAGHIKKHLQEGMMLEVSGVLNQKTFTGNDGKERMENVVTAKAVALSLSQPGLNYIDYLRPEPKRNRENEAPAEQPPKVKRGQAR